jgi:hypothetical protein
MYELISPLTIFASGFRKKSEVLENNLWLVGHCASRVLTLAIVSDYEVYVVRERVYYVPYAVPERGYNTHRT